MKTKNQYRGQSVTCGALRGACLSAAGQSRIDISLLCVKWLIFFVCVGLSACQPESRGFVLPQGNIAEGKQTFIDLNCSRCHSIGDIKWGGGEADDDAHIKLGGEVTSLKTYGELVTSVINPSHKISQQDRTKQILTDTTGASKMELYHYNEIMTVQELVDLVTFLQSEYKLVMPPDPYPYRGF